MSCRPWSVVLLTSVSNAADQGQKPSVSISQLLHEHSSSPFSRFSFLQSHSREAEGTAEKSFEKKSRLCIISKNICIFALSYETTGKVVGVIRLAHEAEHHQSRYDCLSER